MKLLVAAAMALVALAGWAAPASAQPAFTFDWHGSTGWAPLQVGPDRHSYFKLRANGHDAIAMLDPNLPRSLVDADFARTAGLSAGQPLDLSLPRLTIHGLAPAIRDLSGLGDALGRRVQIVVGADAITGLVADIDLLAHRISFNDEAGYVYPDVARYTHLVRRGGVWLAPVSIEGHKPALFALDLVAGDNLQISRAYAATLGLAPSAPSTLTAYDGAAPARQATLHQLKFAGVVMTGMAADVPQHLSPLYADVAQGALGPGVLGRYRVILDLSHDRLYTLLIDPARGDLNTVMFTLLNPTAVPDFGPKPSGSLGR